MKALDITPRLIGKRLRVTAEDLHIEGTLQDLNVLTETTTEGNPNRAAFFEDIIATNLTGIIVRLDNHELRLRGGENVTIIGKVKA